MEKKWILISILLTISLCAWQSATESTAESEEELERNDGRPPQKLEKKLKPLSKKAIERYRDTTTTRVSRNLLYKPFAYLDYDKVIIYDGECMMFAGGVFSDDVKVYKQRVLNQKQVDDLIFAVVNPLDNSEALPAMCFTPRFFIVFYKNNQLVNELDLCFDCHRKKWLKEFEYRYPHFENLSSLRRGDAVSSKIGFDIIQFLKPFNFYYGRWTDYSDYNASKNEPQTYESMFARFHFPIYR